MLLLSWTVIGEMCDPPLAMVYLRKLSCYFVKFFDISSTQHLIVADDIHVPAVVYDMNGREAEDAAPVLEALPDIEQNIFCSSAGVYLKNDQMPHREEDPTDQKSRHKVKKALKIASLSASESHCFFSVTAACCSMQDSVGARA